MSFCACVLCVFAIDTQCAREPEQVTVVFFSVYLIQVPFFCSCNEKCISKKVWQKRAPVLFSDQCSNVYVHIYSMCQNVCMLFYSYNNEYNRLCLSLYCSLKTLVSTSTQSSSDTRHNHYKIKQKSTKINYKNVFKQIHSRLIPFLLTQKSNLMYFVKKKINKG